MSRGLLLALLGLSSSVLSPIPGNPRGLLAQESDQEEEEPGGEEKEDEDGQDEEAAPKLTEREKQILELFNSSSKEYVNGRIVLCYRFETKKSDLVDDWTPPLEVSPLTGKLRWTGFQEGPREQVYTDGEWRYQGQNGVFIGDRGRWLHKARFLSGVEVEVELMNDAHPRAGTIIAPLFFNQKKRRSMGANGGNQLVLLNGWSPVGPPHPKTERLIPFQLKQKIGFKLDGKVLECHRDGKKVADSSKLRSFTDGFDTGQVGIAWSGAVKCFVYGVTISGQLDPDWVAEQLGEKGEKVDRAQVPTASDEGGNPKKR